jgi:hypothetical protein
MDNKDWNFAIGRFGEHLYDIDERWECFNSKKFIDDFTILSNDSISIISKRLRRNKMRMLWYVFVIFLFSFLLGLCLGYTVILNTQKQMLSDVSWYLQDLKISSDIIKNNSEYSNSQLKGFILNFDEFQQDMIQSVNDWNIK